MFIKKKKFYVFSAGCIRRGLDTIRIQKYLEANEWEYTGRIKRADIIVISTCGVVQLNEEASLHAVEESIKNKSKRAKVVVSGCLPKINPSEINKLGEYISIPTGEFEKFDQLINAKVPFSETKPPDNIADNLDITNYLIARSFCRKSPTYKKLFYKLNMNPTFLSLSVYVNKLLSAISGFITGKKKKKIVPYYNIEIARGCLSECTFCATKLAIGNVRSRSTKEIIDEFHIGLKKGYKFFQLISDDTGCYGQDIGLSLPALLKLFFEVEGDYQIIIIDYHPHWLLDHSADMVPLLVKHQDNVKEIFVPLQSGSDRVLDLMKRGYSAGDVKAVLKEIKERAPGIAIRMTLLIGFPGETEEDFKETKEFLSDIELDEVTVNRYEDRPGTVSSKMPEKVAQETIENRARILAEMGCSILS